MKEIGDSKLNISDSLADLTEEEKEIAFSILKEYSENGVSSTYNDMLWTDWDEIPVNINTFLHEKQYLGNALYDQEGRFTLFPYWEEKLKEIFPDNITTKYNTVIFTGAIGLGKSTIAVICLLYLLYRLLCLKDPYLYYGLQPIDKITISLMNITLENAKGVALDKMNQMILSSTWFMSHGQMSGVSNLNYVPDKHIELITASSNNQVVGRCLDEDTEIVTIDGIFKIKDLLNKDIQVKTLDNSLNIVESDTCTIQQTAISQEAIEITLENGSIIKCTPEHKLMLIDGTYKEAQYLTENDELFELSDYKHREKQSGGHNGHATIRYFFKDKVFESRKELIDYLNSQGHRITSCAIRRAIRGIGTEIVYNKYKEVFDNLSWELKDENKEY